MLCAADASTTGSDTPTLPGRSRSCGPACPECLERLAAEAAAFVARLREADLAKVPGVAETIDWTQALVALGQTELSAAAVEDTLGSVMKDHEDLDRVRSLGLEMLVAEAART